MVGKRSETSLPPQESACALTGAASQPAISSNSTKPFPSTGTRLLLRRKINLPRERRTHTLGKKKSDILIITKRNNHTKAITKVFIAPNGFSSTALGCSGRRPHRHTFAEPDHCRLPLWTRALIRAHSAQLPVKKQEATGRLRRNGPVMQLSSVLGRYSGTARGVVVGRLYRKDHRRPGVVFSCRRLKAPLR